MKPPRPSSPIWRPYVQVSPASLPPRPRLSFVFLGGFFAFSLHTQTSSLAINRKGQFSAENLSGFTSTGEAEQGGAGEGRDQRGTVTCLMSHNALASSTPAACSTPLAKKGQRSGHRPDTPLGPRAPPRGKARLVLTTSAKKEPAPSHPGDTWDGSPHCHPCYWRCVILRTILWSSLAP